jgi:hypothetical protein
MARIRAHASRIAATETGERAFDLLSGLWIVALLVGLAHLPALAL